MSKQVHIWRGQNEEKEELEYRAVLSRQGWTLFSRYKDQRRLREERRSEEKVPLDEESTWIEHEEMTVDEMKELRELLWRKYQRRRLPYEHVKKLDKMLEAKGIIMDDA